MPIEKTDVLIVGGGVIGLATAVALLEAGRSVRVIEATHVGAGASHGNCGTLTPSHAPPLAAPGVVMEALRSLLTPDAPLYVSPKWDPQRWRWLLGFALRANVRDWENSARGKYALLNDSRHRIEAWVGKYAMDCQFVSSGEDYVFRSEAAMQHELKEIPLLQSLGVVPEIMDGRSYEAIEPALRPGVMGAIRFNGDAMLRPDQWLACLAAQVRRLGGEILEQTPLQSLTRSGAHWLAESTQRQFLAKDVVIATGAWSPLLAKTVGAPWLRRVIQPGKGYSITYDPPALVPKRPLVLRDRSVCVTAWEGGFRLGSTMEFSGYDTRLNEKRLNALVRGAREFLHVPEGPRIQEKWFGWRPMSVDDMPLLGPVPGQSQLWLATGHGMMGVSMSAGTGQLMADLITGTTPAIDPTPYSPARFV